MTADAQEERNGLRSPPARGEMASGGIPDSTGGMREGPESSCADEAREAAERKTMKPVPGDEREAEIRLNGRGSA